jgi:aminoacrylate hydrolase
LRTGTADGLYYEVHEGDGPAVLLSAGLGGSAAFWTPQMEALTRSFTVVAYDHRGTGRSVRTLTDPHSVEAMAADMTIVLDAAGIQRAHVVGHAAGGLAGLSLALSHPERLDKLVVVNGWSRPDPHIRRCFDTRIRLLLDSGPAAYLHAQPLFLFPADWISKNAARLEQEEAHHLAAFPEPAVMLARIQALLDFDIDDRLGEIAAPVLVSASADDMLVPPLCSRRLADRLPYAVLDMAPFGGHGFTVTTPGVFNASLMAFLAA